VNLLVVGELDNESRARVRARKFEYGSKIVIDRMEARRARSGADENNLAAGLNFCQIDVVSVYHDWIQRFGGPQRQAIETEPNRADR
jgi:hypothetical protein